MTVAVRPAELSGSQAALKRGFDVVVGSIALVLTLPIPGRDRSGDRDHLGRARALPTAAGSPRTAGRSPSTSSARWCPRPTERWTSGASTARSRSSRAATRRRSPVSAKILRALSLDELPQLWNVVRGDMSLVGPRPLPAEQVEANPELLGPRHDVRTGLTGWWQVNGRSDVSPEEAIEQDLFYIENWSISLDLYVIARTVGVLLFRRGSSLMMVSEAAAPHPDGDPDRGPAAAGNLGLEHRSILGMRVDATSYADAIERTAAMGARRRVAHGGRRDRQQRDGVARRPGLPGRHERLRSRDARRHAARLGAEAARRARRDAGLRSGAHARGCWLAPRTRACRSVSTAAVRR